MPTSADWAAYVAGPLVLIGYLVGSIPFGTLVNRRRPHLDADVISPVLTAAATLLVATIAWDVGLEAAPRGAFSAVGTYSNQALGAWASIALWTGTAAVVGSMAPMWTGFRDGGTGVAPAAALLVTYMPLLAAAGLSAGVIAAALGLRWRHVVAAGVLTIIPVEYLAWITDTQIGWGITNGPETALWTAVMAVIILGGNAPRWRDAQ